MTLFHQYISTPEMKAFLENLPCGLFMVDRDRIIRVWNREAERLTGYLASEALGQACNTLLGDKCTEQCGLFNPAHPKPSRDTVCTLHTREGNTLHISKNIDLLRNDQGEVVGGIEFFVDISRRMELETELTRGKERLEQTVASRTAELQQEKTRLQSVLDAMVDLAYVISPDFKLSMVNRAAREVFGDAVGGCCHEVLYGKPSPCEGCPMQGILAGETIRQERTLVNNGRNYEIIHSPFPAADGTTHKLAIFRDITDRKRMEEELRQTNADLDAFTYTVSHDLRSPLTPIIGFAEFLQEEYRDQLDEQGIELLQEIESQGQRMLSMLEDLLQLSRAGRLSAPKFPIDPLPMIEAALTELTDEIGPKGLAIKLENPGLLPISETAVQQLFQNLLGNAVKYAGQGGSIEVGPWATGGGQGFYVRDHGPGISDEEKPKVLTPFFRGETSEGTEGTGVGLAIVNRIVRVFNGRCLLENTPGGGLTVRIDFPHQNQPSQE